MVKLSFGPLLSGFNTCLDDWSVCSCKNICPGCQGQRGLNQGCSPDLCGSVPHSVKLSLISAACQDTLCPTSSPSLVALSLRSSFPRSTNIHHVQKVIFRGWRECWLNLLHFTHTLVLFFSYWIFFLSVYQELPWPNQHTAYTKFFLGFAFKDQCTWRTWTFPIPCSFSYPFAK